MLRSLVNTVELDQESFDAAKTLILCAELRSVRLAKFSFESNLADRSVTEAEAELSSTSDFSSTINDAELTILFDLGIKGHHGEIAVIEINATLEAIYSIPADSNFTDLQIESFARSNGMLNVWPYWREYVQAATQRAGLAPLTLPLFRVTHKPATPKPPTEPAEK